MMRLANVYRAVKVAKYVLSHTLAGHARIPGIFPEKDVLRLAQLVNISPKNRFGTINAKIAHKTASIAIGKIAVSNANQGMTW